MWPKLFCILVAILQCHAAAAEERRAIDLPFVNVFDPAGTLASFQNFVQNIGQEVTQLALQAISVGNKVQSDVQGLAQGAISKVEADVKALLTGTVAQLEDRLKNGIVAKSVEGAQCLAVAVGAAGFSAANETQQAIACVTNLGTSMMGAAVDLVTTGTKALSLGSVVYNNFTSCFPNGFNVGFDTIGNIMCSIGKIGPTVSEIGSIIYKLTDDMTTIQSGVQNFRNIVVRCPREKMADFVINIGGIVTNFGSCIDNLIEDTNTSK